MGIERAIENIEHFELDFGPKNSKKITVVHFDGAEND